VGGARGDRNVPTIVNRAWGSSFLLDGRAATLEEQALQPVLNPEELGMTPETVLELLRSSRYRSEFLTTFGAEPSLEDASRALASYMRTILSGDSPYDRHVLNADAQRGFGLFRGKAGCSACHAGPNFTDEEFHNTGVAWRTGIVTDEGRAGITHAIGDRGAFKTPTLREVSRTAPYMHDGSLGTLDEVIEFYDGGGQPNLGLDPKIRPLHLTGAEKQDLLAFLKSLAGRIQDGY
jgi:cytochrome c peroxidase